MIKVLIILGCLFLFTGCEEKETIGMYACTSEQLKMLEEDYEICTKTGFLDSYCYFQAKKAYCTKNDNNSK